MSAKQQNTLSLQKKCATYAENFVLYSIDRNYVIYTLCFIERKGIKILRHFKKLERSKNFFPEFYIYAFSNQITKIVNKRIHHPSPSSSSFKKQKKDRKCKSFNHICNKRFAKLPFTICCQKFRKLSYGSNIF